VSDDSEYRPLDALPVPVAIVRAWRVAYANPALAKLLGVPREELYSGSMESLIARGRACRTSSRC
jgi:two-component system sensor histidine kinase HydH